MLCCANPSTCRQWSPSGTTPSSHPFATGYWPEANAPCKWWSPPCASSCIWLSASSSRGNRLTPNWELHNVVQDGICFDAVRLWSYRAVRDFWGPNGLSRWQAAVLLGKVDEVNRQFPQPLPFSEVKAIAKSISHWTLGVPVSWAA
uniref:Primase C-terminal 1 domain-containing protein n=1 Tax=Acidithiobacillus ferrianus TaxID=2678518 RepID=A0A845U8C4_9PROT|nr:hypothetical protein [Acidithiobacillus ferrianus]